MLLLKQQSSRQSNQPVQTNPADRPSDKQIQKGRCRRALCVWE